MHVITKIARAIAFSLLLGAPPNLKSAGVTTVTHGLNSDTDDWVLAMTENMSRYADLPGTNATCYLIYFEIITNTAIPSWRRIGGPSALATDSGEIFIKLDWRQLSGGNYSTADIGPVFAYFSFLQTNFIPELGGHALAELPLHFVGHSRGASLVSAMARFLGSYAGVWVDQLSFLDPRPILGDATVGVYENVLYADNYYQTVSLYRGFAVSGSYNRKLTYLGGGYLGFFDYHSDVHLWYHGTIDWRTPTDDYNAPLTSNERLNWWSSIERGGTNAGFYYSRIGRGNRFSTIEPAGVGLGRPIDGVNRRWDFGAGVSDNRISLPSRSGSWPNPITATLQNTSTLFCGESNAITFRYQWGESAGSNCLAEIFLDQDRNPLNGNEIAVAVAQVPGTGWSQVGTQSVSFRTILPGFSPRRFYPFVKMKDGVKMRFLYTTEVLDWRGGCTPPRLSISRLPGNRVLIDIRGGVGERVVLEESMTLPPSPSWKGVATNTPPTGAWSVTNTVMSTHFYRAVLR